MKWLLLAHAGATLVLVGVIWMVQLVHYPLFDRVGAASYTAYQSAHMNAITLLVGPLMLAELMTGLLLLLAPPPGLNVPSAVIGLILIGLVWGMTMFVNVPQHGALVRGFDAEVHRALVMSNWVRTLAWSARGALVLWWLAAAMR